MRGSGLARELDGGANRSLTRVVTRFSKASLRRIFLFVLFFVFHGIAPNPRAANVAAESEYRAVAEALSGFIRVEMQQKEIPAVSIALIDDQGVVWSEGFGMARTNLAATAETMYRVGSVSKLFTDIAVMRLVERGVLDLDTPVTKYVPTFQPKAGFGTELRPITMRQLMAHRGGLVRETPVGSYFHPDEPSLAATIASLNETELAYAPGARTKYSNAGITLVGYVLELAEKRAFAQCVQDLLKPLGMERSAFVRTPAIEAELADGLMWTVHGRTFKAPAFELGISPAACMYSSANELAKFMSAIFAREKGGVLKRETWEEMLKVQFAAPEQKQGFGLGFSIGEMEGERTAGHNGAMYGFATQFTGMLDAKLGVVVIASKDFANTVTGRIATKALQSMLAQRKGTKMPDFRTTEPMDRATARELAGNYRAGQRGFELRASGTNLFMLWNHGGYPQAVRRLGEELITDSALSYGTVLKREGKSLVVGKETFERFDADLGVMDRTERDLIGEYGWDHNTLYILERDGQLWTLIEWFEFNPLTKVSEDVYAFPKYGLYHDEKIIFRRDEFGYAREVVAAGVTFTNRNYTYLRKHGPRKERMVEVKPMRPIAELRLEALKASPPVETNKFRASDLVELSTNDFRFDVRYAREDNFLGSKFYDEPRVFLQRPVAEALKRAQAKLKDRGLGFMLFDGYRPWYVTKIFWDATPEAHRFLVADPTKGSRHNRGAAVDLTLCDLKTGAPIPMPSGYDEPSDRAYPDYPGGDSARRYYRDLLRTTMESEGFAVYPEEWWHFDYNDWREYPILNVPFEKLKN